MTASDYHSLQDVVRTKYGFSASKQQIEEVARSFTPKYPVRKVTVRDIAKMVAEFTANKAATDVEDKIAASRRKYSGKSLQDVIDQFKNDTTIDSTVRYEVTASIEAAQFAVTSQSNVEKSIKANVTPNYVLMVKLERPNESYFTYDWNNESLADFV
jgi:hypothetical protein